MFTQNQDSQLNETFLRTDIKTMRKDLKRLKEGDSLKERQKISAIPVKPAIQNTAIPTPPKPPTNIPIKDPLLQAKINQRATEEEKQRIFAAKSEKLDLEKQIAALPGQAMPIASEKERIVRQQQQFRQKLDSLTQKEKTETSEDKKEILEKKQWQQQQELKKREDQLENLEQKKQEFAQKEENTKKQLADIDNSLKTIYTDVAKREPVKPAAQPAFAPSFAEASAGKQNFGAAKEDAQRKKFLEDVEAWAASSNDN